MSSPLQNNITNLQNILDSVNALPEAGTDLPELSNPADASKVLSGYEFINENGEKAIGTVTTKTASNLTASGATVTVPAGYYASQATKSVATATQATPSVSIDSAGKITATATQTAGYVAAGTKTNTKQMTVQAAKTITPSTSSQTAVAKNVYTTGAVTVAAIPSTYVKPTATKSATTYTPTTSNQTIAAGTYCSGAQTIKGDTNLVPANILGGKSIFGVSGGIETFDGSYECSGDSTGGGSGGVALETCTVTVTSSNYCNIICSILSGGNITNGGATDVIGDIVLDNVISNTLITVDTYPWTFYDCRVTNGSIVHMGSSGVTVLLTCEEGTDVSIVPNYSGGGLEI